MKIQPTLLAANGRASPATAAIQNQRGTVPLALRRVSHRPTSETSAASSPKPIMSRNVQYVIGMTGR